MSQTKKLITNAGENTRFFSFLAWSCIVASCCVVFYGNLRFADRVLAVGFEDDFFYYLEAARRFALTGQSTFDGIHLTNGYHPLWFLTLTFLYKIFGIGGVLRSITPIPLALALETTQLAIVVAISYLVRKISEQITGPVAAICIQLLAASWAIVLLRTGMEAGAVLLAALAMLWFRLRENFTWTYPSIFLYGLLGSLTILSRLDGVLLVSLLFAFDLLPQRKKFASPVRAIASFLAGFWPLATYVALNILIFHTATPVSGSAKQLRHHHLPSLDALHSFLYYLTAKTSVLLLPFVLLTFAGLATLLLPSKEQKRKQASGIFTAVLLFPLVQLGMVSSLSDWALWQWYLYPWLLSGVIGGSIVASRIQPVQPLSNSGFISKAAVSICCSFLILYSCLVAHYSSPDNNLTYLAGLQIRDFKQSHEGIYAMGDRAGAVGYLFDGGVLQLEGLMMDKVFLENIRQSRDLVTVLHELGVQYYVATRAELHGNCYQVKEPWQAGPDSPVMRGTLCQKPIATFTHGPFVNDIFDLAAPSSSTMTTHPAP